jgi:hypothetical protein
LPIALSLSLTGLERALIDHGALRKIHGALILVGLPLAASDGNVRIVGRSLIKHFRIVLLGIGLHFALEVDLPLSLEIIEVHLVVRLSGGPVTSKIGLLKVGLILSGGDVEILSIGSANVPSVSLVREKIAENRRGSGYGGGTAGSGKELAHQK